MRIEAYDCLGSAIEPAATPQAIGAIVELYGGPLPGEYVELLRRMNGWVGRIRPCGDENAVPAYLALYAAERVPEMNLLYEVPTLEPNLLLIGDNGGGSAILLSHSDENGQTEWIMLEQIDFGTKDLEERGELRYSSFEAMIDAMIG